MERRISPWILLSLVLSGVDALEVVIPKQQYEFARGDNITLPCSFKPANPATVKFVVITWDGDAPGMDPTKTLILTYYSVDDILNIKPQYKSRMSLDVNIAEGKANLKLSSITLADNKEYKCQVQIPGDDDGTPAATTNLVVLVAPSTPTCAIQGTAEYAENINLTCFSKEGSPPPVYTWKSLDVLKNPRRPDPRTTDKGGILSLYNISKETSGYYICTSANKIRSATCNLTLSVMPPTMKFNPTAGIIGGVAALLIVIVIGICCCCYRKRKKLREEEELAMRAPQEGYDDKNPERNGVTRINDGEEDDRVHDDTRRPFVSSDRSERDYDDRRSDYDDRRSDHTDRRSDYDDRREKHSDRNERYDDRRRHDDRRQDRRVDHDDDRYDEPNRDLDKPPVPANKPPKDYRD